MILLLAILPPLLIAYYIYQKDKYDKEPKSLIIKSFLFGCLGIIPAIFLELFAEGMFNNLILYVFIGIALVEEGVKYFFLKKYLFNKPEFNEPMDGIVYAVMISLGFATVENIFYVFNHPGQEMQVAIMRMFTAIPLHAACGVILGYFVGLAKFSDNKNILLYKGLFLATLVHGLYNYFIFLEEGWFIFSIIALVVAVYYSKKAISLHQKDSKQRNL
jgi:RsiW-degrading membrane proteinase PrsW (M82 family)